MIMEKTWRWFGHSDAVTLDMLRQIGVEGIVTALHNVPNGQVWELRDIGTLRDEIASHGMRWSVVESLPVSEEIKFAGPGRDALIENYVRSLENLGKAGIHTVCYNFMPVIDWIRTDLEHPLPDGTSCLYFDYVRFAYFDMFILGREGARNDFPDSVVLKAEELDRVITSREKHSLVENIIVRTQGFVNGNINEGDAEPVEKFRKLLKAYDGVTRDDLRESMKYFLEAIMPVCNKYDIRMCVHPDDPPMQVLGLPRIVCNADDIDWILSAVDDFHNGLTFCAGSLSAGPDNDVVSMAARFAPRTHFVHMRSCDILPGGNFIEASHTGGRADLVELVRIFERQGRNLPMRVDHGRLMMKDSNRNPGYSFHGRMLALGQVEGMMSVVKKEIEEQKI